MNKKKLIALCALALCLDATAQTTETVILTNGSRLDGYLAEQRPGVDFTVHSTSAVVFASEDSLTDVTQQQVALDMLPQAWTDWAVKNKLAQPGQGGQTLTLSTLHFKNSTLSNVYVKERGVTVRFVDMNERDYVYPWAMLGMTSKHLRAKNQFSGISEELVLKDGQRYEGQVTDQMPGKSIKIILDNGQVQSFNYSDIAQIISKPINAKLTIWQQTQLLDEVVMKDSGHTLRGMIMSRRLGEDYTFMQHDGQTTVLKRKDVAVMRKIKNHEYVSATDRLMADGEILINGSAKNAYFFDLESDETFVFLQEDAASMQLERGDTIVVEANLPNPNALITIAKSQLRTVQLLNKKGKKVKEKRHVVTLVDLLRSKEYGQREITPLGHIKYTIPIRESGDYVMQIQGQKGYIVVFVPDRNAKTE